MIQKMIEGVVILFLAVIAATAHLFLVTVMIIPIGLAFMGLSYTLLSLHVAVTGAEIDVFLYASYVTTFLTSIWVLYNKETVLDPKGRERRRRRRKGPIDEQ
jgi:hypothetical protein